MPISTYVVPSSRLVHETKVDFSYRSVNRTIHVVQYDKQLPIIAVTLYVSGKLYTLPANFDVNVKFGKRDNTFVYKPVLGCNANRSVVYFEMDEQMTFLAGSVNPIIELSYNDNGTIQRAGSSAIAIEIERNPIQETDIESTSEYVDLNKAVSDAQAAQAAAEQAESDAVAAAALAAQEAANSEIAKDQAQAAQMGAVAARDELAQTIIEVNRIDERLKDHDAELALKLDKPVGTFDITRKTVNDITAKYENEIITGSKATIKGLLGKSAHLKNIYNHGLTIKGRTEGKGKVAYVNKTIDEPIAALNNKTLREVFEGGNKFLPYNDSYQASFSTTDNVTTVTQLATPIGYVGRNYIGNLISKKLYVRCDITELSGQGRLYIVKSNPYAEIGVNLAIGKISFLLNDDTTGSAYLHLRTLLDGSINSYVKQKNNYIIDRDELGIASLSLTDMDYYYSLYQARKNITKKVLTYADIFETFNRLPGRDFTNLDYWSVNSTGDGTAELSNGRLKLTATLSGQAARYSGNAMVVGETYYAAYDALIISGRTQIDGFGSWENSLSGIISKIGIAVLHLFQIKTSVAYNPSVSYIDNAAVIDIRNFDESITKEVLDTLYSYYLKHKAGNINHVVNPELLTTSKNLFDKTQYTDGYLTINGSIAGLAPWFVSDYIPVKENTNYYLTGWDGSEAACYEFLDKNKVVIHRTKTNSYPNAIMMPMGCAFFRFSSGKDKNIVQFEESSVATPYVPNFNNSISFPVPRLSALDNRVTDMIHHVNGKWYYEKRIEFNISDFSTMQWGDGALLNTTYRFAILTSFSGMKFNGSYAPTNTTFIVGDENYPCLIDYSKDSPHFYINQSSFLIWIPKDVIDGQVGATSVDKFKAYLATNQVILMYELATPVITEITPTGDMIKSAITHVIQQQELPTEISLPNLITTSERMAKFDVSNYRDLINTRYYLDGNASVMLDLQQLVDEKQIPAATKVAYETWLEANTTLKVGDYFDEFKHDLKLRKYKSISENLLPGIPEIPDDIFTPVARLNGKTLKEVFEDGLVSIPNSDFTSISTWQNVEPVNTLFTTNGGIAKVERSVHTATTGFYQSGLSKNKTYFYVFRVNTILSNNFTIGDGASIAVNGKTGWNTLYHKRFNGENYILRVYQQNMTAGSYFEIDYIKTFDVSDISTLTQSEIEYWYNVYDYLKNGTQMTLLKQQLPIKPSTKLNFGYNGTPTELRMEYLDRFDKVISSEVKTTFLGTAYKYGNFTVPATAVKVNAYIKPSELITGPFIADLKAFIKFDKVNGSPLTNPNKYMWTPYEEDVIIFDQTLRKLINNNDISQPLNIAGSQIDTNLDGIWDGWAVDVQVGTKNRYIQADGYQYWKGATYNYQNRFYKNSIGINKTDIYYVSFYTKHVLYGVGDNYDFFRDAITYANWSHPSILITPGKNTRVVRVGSTQIGTGIMFYPDQTNYEGTVKDIIVINLSDLVRKGIILTPTKEAFEAIQDELDLESLNLIKRLDDNGAVLAEPVVTPIPQHDYDAMVYNYGMELFELDSSILGDLTMSYYRDTATQVDTSISLIEDILDRLAALEALHN